MTDLTQKLERRDLPELRGRRHVFRDRAQAGEVLARLLEEYRGTDAVVVAIPAGGVPVAVALARELGLPLEVAPVSKITPPGNTEVGYGAVAFDGSFQINERARSALNLTPEEVEAGIEATRRKVSRRLELFRGSRKFPDLSGRTAILVDDGLASGLTMRVAAEAIRAFGAPRIVVAAPTAHREACEFVGEVAEAVAVANLRGGGSFAVADAYEVWSDVTEEEARASLEEFREARSDRG